MSQKEYMRNKFNFFGIKDKPRRKATREFMQKAIGWSLREYSRIGPEVVKNFI